MPLNNNLIEQLKRFHANIAAQHTAFVNPRSPIVAALVTNKVISVDHAFRDPTDPNKFAVTVTPEGLAELGIFDTPAAAPELEAPAAPAQAAVPAAGPAKTRRSNIVPVIHAGGVRIPMPKIERKIGHREETYPFSTLLPPAEENGEILYDSFFVEKTADNPNPVRSLAGTVSSANKRYRPKGYKFSVVHVECDPEHGKEGARVLRIA